MILSEKQYMLLVKLIIAVTILADESQDANLFSEAFEPIKIITVNGTHALISV